MYGSDKVLLSLVIGLALRDFFPIVLLPEEGPLYLALVAAHIECHIVQVTKLNRETLSFKGLISLPLELLSSIRVKSRIARGRHIDLVYSNTLAVLGAAVYAKFRRIPHLWHVHELLLSPRVVRQGFPWVLRLLADRVICNSTLTAQWLLNEQPKLSGKTDVIWNGLGERPAVNQKAVTTLRESLGLKAGQLLVVLTGRINRWKGQDLFVDAATTLWERGIRNVHYLMVGGVAAGQEQLIDTLRQKIGESPVGSQIHLMQFTDDIWNVWDACDIAVVPSTEPEPFGMVAIEAMASRKPVVVAAHGGLLDIVEDGVSGLLFKPNDVTSFADQLQKLIASPQLRERLGAEGRARQTQLFSLDAQLNRTVEVIHQMTTKKLTFNG